MSAYERRIIHSEIQTIEGVSTNSIGSDNNRKIVIFLTDKKPEGIFEEDETTETVTGLREEFAPEADDVTASIGAIDVSVSVDACEDETVAVETTVPDESEELVTDDEDGIK